MLVDNEEIEKSILRSLSLKTTTLGACEVAPNIGPFLPPSFMSSCLIKSLIKAWQKSGQEKEEKAFHVLC